MLFLDYFSCPRNWNRGQNKKWVVLGVGVPTVLARVAVISNRGWQLVLWRTYRTPIWSLTGEGGCCLSVPTKFFPLSSAFAWVLCGPSLSSVAKWNSWGWVRLSTADLHGMYDCPARAFFMETLFCRSFSLVSFCFCAMISSSCCSRFFCAWIAAALAWFALLVIESRSACQYDAFELYLGRSVRWLKHLSSFQQALVAQRQDNALNWINHLSD